MESAKWEGGNDGVQDADRVWRVIGGDSDSDVMEAACIADKSAEGDGDGESADKDGASEGVEGVLSATDDDSVRERGECRDEKESAKGFDEIGDRFLGEKEEANQPL